MKDVITEDLQLLFGDCLERMKEIPDGSVDLVLVDSPYATTQNKWDSMIDLEEMWIQLDRICKPNTAKLMFAQTPFDKILGCSNLKELKYEWIWEKTTATGHLNAKKMPMKSHENVLVFYEALPTYNPQKNRRQTIQSQADRARGYRSKLRRSRNQGADGYCKRGRAATADAYLVRPRDRPASHAKARGTDGIPHPHLHQRRSDCARQYDGQWNDWSRVR